MCAAEEGGRSEVRAGKVDGSGEEGELEGKAGGWYSGEKR